MLDRSWDGHSLQPTAYLKIMVAAKCLNGVRNRSGVVRFFSRATSPPVRRISTLVAVSDELFRFVALLAHRIVSHTLRTARRLDTSAPLPR